MPNEQTNATTSPANSSYDIASEWALYEKLLRMGSSSAGDTRELAIEQSVEAFQNGMAEDPAYQANAIVEGTITPIIASRNSALECDIKAAPNTDLHIGDLVECLDEKWLVVELYTDKVGIINGKMWVCNDIIRFQNRSTNVVSRYCVVDDGSYSRKTIDPIAYVPVNTYKLYLSMDAETIKLYIDKRLSFGKIYAPDGSQVLEVYKVIGMDLKSKNFGEGSHLMVLTMQRDVYNEATDDFSNALCDCYVAPNETLNSTLTGSCVITGRDVIRIGTTRKYTAIFTDAQGNAVTSAVPVWETFLPSGVTQEISQDNSLTINVPLDESLVGTEITIALKDADDVFGTFAKKVGVVTVG